MALLTTGNFYEVALTTTAGAGWSAIGAPEMSSFLTARTIDGASFVIYVVNSATGAFAYVGGSGNGFDDGLLSTSSAAFATTTITDNSATDIVYGGPDGSGNIYTYKASEGYLRYLDTTEAGALKVFLP